MRHRIWSAAVAAAALIMAAAVPASADNYPVRDGTGASQTFCSKLVGGLQYPCHLIFAMFGSTPTPVTSDGTNLNVHVQASELPSGAATSANQASANTKLDQLHVDLTAALPAGTNLLGKFGIDQTTPGTTNGVVVNTSALPTGAATAANQSTGNTSLSAISTASGAPADASCGSDAGTCSEIALMKRSIDKQTQLLAKFTTDGNGNLKATAVDSTGQALTYPSPAPVALPADAVFTCSATGNGDATCLPTSPIFVSGYSQMNVQLGSVPTGGATVTFQESETSSGSYTNLYGQTTTNTPQSFSAVTVAGTLYRLSPSKPWVKFVISGFSGTGSVTMTVTLKALPAAPGVLVVTGPAGEGGFPQNFQQVGCESRTSQKGLVASGSMVRCVSTQDGRMVVQPESIPEMTWSYAAASGGIVNTTTAVQMKAAGGSTVRNYVRTCQVSADALGGATELVIRDGAAGTVLSRLKVPAAGLPPTNLSFTPPLRPSLNTLVEAATITAVTGGVYVNCQGYSAP